MRLILFRPYCCHTSERFPPSQIYKSKLQWVFFFSLFCSHHFKHPIIHFYLFLHLALICCCEIPDLIIINNILNMKNVSFIRMALMSPPPVQAKEYFSNPLTLPNNLGWKLLLAKFLEKIFPKKLESWNKSKHCIRSWRSDDLISWWFTTEVDLTLRSHIDCKMKICLFLLYPLSVCVSLPTSWQGCCNVAPWCHLADRPHLHIFDLLLQPNHFPVWQP